jgi:hypothetical protein
LGQPAAETIEPREEDPMSTAYTRCDRSFPLVHPELVDAAIVPIGEEAAERCPAELREISPSSAKLLVDGPPKLPCRCSVSLNSSKLAQSLNVPAEIDWVRPNPAGDWLVECAFERRMSEAAFGELLASGLLERRSSVRYQTRINVGVQWGPAQPRFEGIVRDLSEGGLCLMTACPPQNTRDVYVILDTPQGEVPIRLKIRWTLCIGPNHLIGCQFVDDGDFGLLRRLPPATRGGLHEYSPATRPPADR